MLPEKDANCHLFKFFIIHSFIIKCMKIMYGLIFKKILFMLDNFILITQLLWSQRETQSTVKASRYFKFLIICVKIIIYVKSTCLFFNYTFIILNSNINQNFNFIFNSKTLYHNSFHIDER